MQTSERIVRANDVDLCVETFGDPDHPALLLVSGSSMLWWGDELCALLAAGSRFVVRYDVRDTGRSVAYPAGAPDYDLRTLASDAIALLDVLGISDVHLVGSGVGGWIGQLAALDHPKRIASLTLMSTRPIAHGACDPDLPDHTPEIMAFFAAAGTPDWSDRASVVEHLVASARAFSNSRYFDEDAQRLTAGRVVDRTTDVAASLTNIAFTDPGERWRERLGEVRAPTLVVHGTEDPFFPHGNGVALAEEIPGARLLSVDGMGSELPPAVWDVVVPAILEHTAGSPS